MRKADADIADADILGAGSQVDIHLSRGNYEHLVEQNGLKVPKTLSGVRIIALAVPNTGQCR
jgi:hypothetical protein